MARDLAAALRELCLGYPETEEVRSHGAANFRVRGKTFAIYQINHHGDGRVALWLDAPPGAQQLYTEMEPEAYFVPPYVGPRGWLGVALDKLSWPTTGKRVREAYENVAPRALLQSLPEISVAPPARMPRPEDIDPFLRPRARKLLERLGRFCEALPETSRAIAFGSPIWKAGSKTFTGLHAYSGRLMLSAWVGADRQTMLTFDERYRTPAYLGHNGWIELDLQDSADWQEIEGLLLDSYRHFALKRMLRMLDGSGPERS